MTSRRARIAWVSIAAVLVLTASLLVAPSEAIWLSIPNSGTKCVSEDIQSNVVVLADYYVIYNDIDFHDNPNQTIHIPNVSARVTSPYGNNLHHQENVTQGQFAFTTTEGGNYLACFWLDKNAPEGSSVSVALDWKTGIAAKDWESVARKEKLEGVDLELVKLQGMVEAIRGNLIYLKHREATMREVSEATNARVAWLSIMSIGICIVASALQLWYLKRFFVKKKLI